ncbi:MAG: FHA domain-containing protein [Dehalococcoidia bacterium]|nr:FHA domain-containing protein [Dehalococcoidia bacterium]
MKFGQLRVTTPDGSSREFPLDLPTVIVGRGAGNGITLDDLSVARRHARLTVDSGHLFVEDLGSVGGTFIGGQRLEPNTRYLVERLQDLRFGEVPAAFDPPASLTGQAFAPAAVLADEMTPTGMPTTLRVHLASPLEPIEVGGQPGLGHLEIANRGRIVDDVTVRVDGIPAEWVRMSAQRFPLLPGAEITIDIAIQPPRTYASKAGDYDFAVSVLSGETGREVISAGKVTVLPFAGTSLSLQPVRGKRDFTLLAENQGNATINYALAGVDDEEAFHYEFQRAAIELEPGERETVPFEVRPHKKRWFGKPATSAFQVIATPSDPTLPKAATQGQLAIAPPLERIKRPAALAVIALIAALAALALLFIPSDDNDATPANAEALYDGVHMCDKSDEEDEDPPEIQVSEPAPGGGTGAPFFAQNDEQWANVEYARAQDPEFGPDWCGDTIAQCGCAMTSVATVLALFEIVTMPDGSELSPETVNAWFNGQARKTDRGWVSQGYIYGDVIWTAANQLSAEIAETRPGTRTVRFAGIGTGSDDEVRSELRAGRPIVLEVPGHWIAAVGLDGDQILINDPFYRDRTTLDVYAGKVLSSVKFEPSSDLSAIVVTAPSDVRVRITDKEGRVVGTLNSGTPEEAEAAAQNGIPGATYDSKIAWRDPNCVESPPPAGAGVNQITLPGRAEDYKIEALDSDGGPAEFTLHSYDQDGGVTIKTEESNGPLVVEMEYDPADEAGPTTTTRTDVTPSPDAPRTSVTAQQGSSPSANASGTGTGSPGASASPTGSGTPSPTGTTPAGGTPTGTGTASPTGTTSPTGTASPGGTAPQAVNVACGTAYQQTPQLATVSCTAQVQGQYNSTRWSVNDLAYAAAAGQVAFTTTFTSNTTATIQMAACNGTLCTSSSRQVVVDFSAGGDGTVTPPPATATTPSGVTPVSTAPQNVGMVCSAQNVAGVGVVTCSVSATTPFTSVQWSAGGGSPSSGSTADSTFSTQRATSGTVSVSASACNGALCTPAPPQSVAVSVPTATATATPTSPPIVSTMLEMYLDSEVTPCYGGGSGFIPFWGMLSELDETPVVGGFIQLYMDGSPAGSTETNSGGSFFTDVVIPYPGAYSFWAQYSGDGTYGPSTSETVDLMIQWCGEGGGGSASTLSGVTLGVSPGDPPPLSDVTLVATLSPVTGEPFGLVDFYDGDTYLTSAFAFGDTASVTITLGPGPHSFWAYHWGTSYYFAAYSPELLVNPGLAPTSTLISLPYTSVMTDADCTYAYVEVSDAAATGTVELRLEANPTVIASGTISGGSAWIYFCGSAFPANPANYQLYASYLGDSTFAASQSATTAFTVQALSQTAVFADPSEGGSDYVYIYAYVIRPGFGSPQPQGTVAFTSDQDGDLGSATVFSGSAYLYDTILSAPAEGCTDHVITAFFTPDSGLFAPSNASITVTACFGGGG